jgi:hypothetical protein
VSVAAVAYKRRRVREPPEVELTTSAVAEHFHVAIFDEFGDGWTTPAGSPLHAHRVVALELVPNAGHTHILTAERAPAPPKAPRRKRR